MNMLTSIATYRGDDNTNNRPITFVCHSLGGLVCQDALVTAGQRPEHHLRNILYSTRGIIFLGTPHHGAGLAKWAEMLAKSIGILKQTNPDILAVLETDSEVLARIQDSFHTMIRSRNQDGARPIEMTCFYEELPLPGIGVVVPPHSAILPGYIPIGIHSDHMDMTKFEHEEDPGFNAVAGELRRWTKALSTLGNALVAGEDVSQETETLPSSISSTSPLHLPERPVLAQGSSPSSQAVIGRVGQSSSESQIERIVIESAPSSGFFVSGWTILHAAVRNGDIEGVKATLAAGIFPTCKTEDMAWTPLWIAACTQKLEIAEILLNAGADVNAMTNDGRTAINEAAKIGATEIIQLLINHGADMELSAAKFGETPLLSAAAKGHIAAVRTLLTAGANIRASQFGGWTALHYALLNKSPEMACMILKYSPDVNAATTGGARALHLAALAGMASLASQLLDIGAEIDAVESGELTALRVAVQAGELETVKMLVRRGARTNVVDGPQQHTLMDVALRLGHTSVYLYLQQLSAVSQNY